MRSSRQRFGGWALIAGAMLFALACGALGMLAVSETAVIRRAEAQGRWDGRSFSSYRIAVRVEYSGSICSQELETTGERIRRIVSNNCRMSWLSLMTVARLFEISERLEQPAPCYATIQTCLCHRIRVGEISYDPRLGYPSIITYRREVEPNLAHVEFWKRVWETRKLPRCSPADQNVRITITSLTPLPQ